MKNSRRKTSDDFSSTTRRSLVASARDMGAEDVRDGEEGEGEEWRDPSVAAWEEAAAAVSSSSSRAQHAEPWTESLAPALRDAIDALDWSQTHAALIPNAWNRVRLATFAETWAVLGVWPPADTHTEEKAATRKRRVVLEAYGDGGVHRALARLRPDDVQYLAMRVTTDGGEPRFIAAAWLGPTSPAFIPDDDEDEDDDDDDDDRRSTTRGDDPEGTPADANPRARWRREWAAVRHYLAGAHAYVAVDGREFAAGGGEGDGEAPAGGAASSPSRFDFAAATRANVGETAPAPVERAKTTHYDYDAPGDAERNAAGEGVDALAAALATLQDDDDGRVSNREGTNHETEGSADDLGSVDARAAAVEARGEALASLRAELAAHAHVLHRAAVERARASHERARAQTLRATESIGAAKSEALRRRLATRAADREAQAGE